MNKKSCYAFGWLAASVVSTLAAAPAVRAADLSGDCCADLEERIAELEATTARKGNRKVSLTISGYIAQEITVWDDGDERNAYVHGLGPTQTSHVKFNGKATISPGWTAGYMLRIQDLTGNAFGGGADAINQNNATKNDNLNTQMSFWYLESENYGKVSVGRLAHAAKSAAMFTDLSGTQIIDNYTFLAGFPQFRLREASGALSPLTWGQLGFCYTQGVPLGGDCNGIVMNGVRYDTPVFAGFSASASWGEDDFWEVGLRYAGTLAGFKLAFGAGYTEMSSEATSAFVPTLTPKDSHFFQVGGYAEHLATGLFIHGAYGNEDNNDTLLANGFTEPDSEHYYVKAGIRRKWLPLGATVVYGDYAAYLDQLGPAALAAGATSSTLERFGGGVAQEIDAAAMTLYLKYQHYQADVDGLTEFEDADFVSFGGLIAF
ncbi:porin [Hyphomicrobium sp. CS1GBMeth3]|uniref:porin n=1 Tax=Hyphomicrobium sp. CS1GBMeth3 TaxID=1892845 RepID=UPI0009308E96|nr:porin [Hyphomicrobium sp. CS1GBMeth3]